MRKLIWATIILCLCASTANAQLRSLKNLVHRVTSPTQQAEMVVDEEFFHKTVSQFSFAATRYIAQDASGASCSNDGTSPTFVSGTTGPWTNFGCLAARQALAGSPSTFPNGLLVYVRYSTSSYDLMASSGTYGTNGLAVNGTGSVISPLVFSGYPSDSVPTITGSECYTRAQAHEIAQFGTKDGAPFTISVRQTLNVSGNYVIVENLNIRCGFRHDVQYSCSHCAIRNNTTYGAYEDGHKVLVTASHFYIGNNDISGFSSQGVDWYAGDYGFITQNTFHDPVPDPPTDAYDAQGVGMKGGVRYAALTRNIITNLTTGGTQSAFSCGGAPNAAIDERDGGGHLLPSARDVKIMGNVIMNYYGWALAVTGGVDCEFSDNQMIGTYGLAYLGTNPDVRNADPTNYSDQPYASGELIKRNTMSFLPVTCPASSGQSCFSIYVANTDEVAGFVGLSNIYISIASTSPGYTWGIPGGQLTKSAFQTASGTESTSTVITP